MLLDFGAIYLGRLPKSRIFRAPHSPGLSRFSKPFPSPGRPEFPTTFNNTNENNLNSLVKCRYIKYIIIIYLVKQSYITSQLISLKGNKLNVLPS